jgi:hypothetical protein
MKPQRIAECQWCRPVDKSRYKPVYAPNIERNGGWDGWDGRTGLTFDGEVSNEDHRI